MSNNTGTPIDDAVQDMRKLVNTADQELGEVGILLHRADHHAPEIATEEAPTETTTVEIEEGTPVPFLVELGVMTPDGKVRKSRYDKFRQVNRFLELVDDVLPALRPEGALRVVDFGCGKSYLTFAIHHLLTELRGREVDLVGLDLKEDVIATCAAFAARSGAAGLRFERGDIAGFDAPGTVDLVVSLHACDTATDEALAGRPTLDESTAVDLPIPPTIGALLAARLDRLPEAERHVLERASVVGRTFWTGALTELLPDPFYGSEAARALGRLGNAAAYGAALR